MRIQWRQGAALSVSAATLLALSSTVSAEEFRWAGTTDPSTLDPHAAATAPVLGFLNNVYEGLVRRNKAMKIEPSLATAWEPIGADGWRFTLREGVTFQDGSAFTADDVLFSYERASSEESERLARQRKRRISRLVTPMAPVLSASLIEILV